MLEKLLRSKAEVRILGVALFSHGLHLREISRKSGVSSFETKKELDNLVELGVLRNERRGNQLAFFPNDSCSFFPELKGLYMKTEGVFFELKQELSKISDLRFAFVFGSTASNKEKPASDIDLMVIGDIEEERLSDAVFKIQKKIGREINFIHWSENDLKDKVNKNSSFLKSILRNTVFLVGDADEFGRIVEKRPGKKG
jgi:predicted nucleotidyltransferase